MSVQPGRHDAKIISTRLETSKTGSECVAVACRVEDQGVITWRGWLTDAAIEFTIKALEQVGWDREANKFDLDSVDNTDLLVGNDVSIVCEEEVYEDKPRVVVRWLNGTDFVGAKVSEESKASLRDRIRSLGGKTAVAEKPKPKAVAQKTTEKDVATVEAVLGEDDDTPF